MARETFDHQEIEKKAQAKWAELNLYETNLTDESKEKYYLLFEFPYPSGDLHIGHWYAFALTDIYARKLRMAGKNVLFPMGFDAFGLPAENAAIKNKVDPKKWTYENMERMRKQIATMGASMDWSKEVITCDPSYYKWTQWLFTKFYEHGLAERKLASVKWCPHDQTVLANEQVIDGKCERCGHEVEEKMLTQWFLKITNYAERLLKDLDGLAWPNEIKEAQRAWIGKSEGMLFTAPVKDTELTIQTFSAHFEAFAADTFVVIAPDHPRLAELIAGTPDEQHVLAAAKGMVEKRIAAGHGGVKELEGIFTGRYMVDPVGSGDLPLWVANYALADYGTGIVKCSAHDERDFAFAKKYDIPLKPVMFPEDAVLAEQVRTLEVCFTDMDTGVLSEPAPFVGKIAHSVRKEIIEYLEEQSLATRQTSYRLRDWSVGRQRYWGCPIPMVYDPEGNAHVIPSEHLPWLLPEDVDFTPGAAGAGKSPLASSKELKERVTRIFGEGWTPEYDTLDTFVDSSWYFMRYLDPKDEHDFTDQALAKKWMPIDRYSGGSEHTTMHLLYARFFTKVLHDFALSPMDEPFTERYNRGIILGPDGAKMSKSKGNVINPDEVVGKFGADAVRMYLAFIGPYNEAGHYPWNLDGALAMRKFLDRVYALSSRVEEGVAHQDTARSLAVAIAKVTTEIDRFKFNTAISALMILTRDLESLETVPDDAWITLLTLLAPLAPHLTEHLWEKMGGEGSVHTAPWPLIEAGALEIDEAVVAVQVNGKKRGEITLAPDSSEDEALQAAVQIPSVKASLNGVRPKRVIYVPGRILNLVV